MSKSIYITPLGPESGKGLVSLGVMDLLASQVGRVGYFRPVIAGRPEDDSQVRFMNSRYEQRGLDADQMFGAKAEWARDCLLGGKQDELLKRIIERFEKARRECDFMVCEGTDFRGHTAPFEFEFNLEVASNLGCALLPVINGKDRTAGEIADALGLAFGEVKEQGLALAATVVNRVAPGEGQALLDEIGRRIQGHSSAPVYTLEATDSLERPTMGDIARQIEATVLHGEGEELNREVRNFKVAAMRIPHFLEYVEDGSLVITAGDRADVVLACAATLMSDNHPKIAGLMLTGGLMPEPSVVKLLQGLSRVSVPVLSVTSDTYAATEALRKVEPALVADNESRVAAALAVFEAGVNAESFEAQLNLERPERITPMMFEHRLTERAKAERKHIVLPEGEEERTLRATEILLRRGVVDVTLLGDPAEIERKGAALALEIGDAKVIHPPESSLRDGFAETYCELRKHKCVSPEAARDVMTDVSYFGTMMVHKGLADGMVSGSVHTTQHTIRPSFEIIKTRKGFAVVSSVFFMCLKDRVLVYGDCAVNPNPTAEQLADIALASAETAEQFGIEPRVAMLSYSTGQSGKGSDVEVVREAARIAQERRPNLPVEGPIQYDAAIDASVAETKLPGSEVAGRATVFIFPDLNTGNNTYKAVQRSSGAVAIGPMLQGLNKPVNDLSRGCSVADITNTVAITAIQAQCDEATDSE